MKRKWMTLAMVALLLASAATGKAMTASAASAQTSAECMALIEQSTGRVLYERNMDKKHAMASTTKIVTAITVLEHCDNLDKVVKIPKEAVGVEGSSIYLQAGEPLTVRDLLYGLMLQSGNDCAVALAVTTGGSVPGFAKLMNETAVKAGAKNSNFVNPHGLHHNDHYTTARDLAMITAHAMNNPTFKEIVKTKKYEAPWEGRNYNRIIVNKNKLLASFDGADGVKTGFTKAAGRCLVSSATRDGMQVICVVFNCGPMFEDCAALMNRAFGEYALTKVGSRGTEYAKAAVERGKKSETVCGLAEDLYYPLKKDGSETVTFEAELSDRPLIAPVRTGTECGKIKFYMGKQLIFDAKLYTIKEVQSRGIIDRLKDIVENWAE